MKLLLHLLSLSKKREKQVIFCKLCFNEKGITQVKEDEKPIGFIRTSSVEKPVFENDLHSRKFLNLKKKVKTH